ncbi:MAG: transposase [Rhodanobacteraceae bacterium]|nr:transposase [Rhodanobacteraceae bacterium]
MDKAHVRRLYFELHTAQASTQADHALRFIAELYRIETEAKGLDPPARQVLRQHKARPVLDDFQRWIADVSARVLPNSGLAKALTHTRKRWPSLVRYVDDGLLPIGRVGMWRGSGSLRIHSVSTSRSSNRTCRFPASGSLSVHQTFAFDKFRRGGTRRISPNVS